MQKQVTVNGKVYTATNIGVDTANFEVTKKGEFLKSFSVQTIGGPSDPEPDCSGVYLLFEDDIQAIEAILPAFPTAELWDCLN